MKPIIGNTGVIVLPRVAHGTYVIEQIKTVYSIHQIRSKNKIRHLLNYAMNTGCYVFTNLKNDSQYFGSAKNLYGRYKIHIFDSSRPKRGKIHRFIYQ